MDIDEIQLASIDIDRLDLIVERIVTKNGSDHSRWVFRSPSGVVPPLVYKIWNPGYVRRDNILTGLETGLYSDATVPGLRALIMERDQCRGYVMQLGTKLRTPSEPLVHALWEATRTSRHFIGQYRASHTRNCAGRASLIDLEAVHRIGGEPGWPKGTVDIEDPDYAALVARLETEELSAQTVREMADCHIRQSCTRLSAFKWISRKANGALRRLRHQKLLQRQGDGRDAIIRDL